MKINAVIKLLPAERLLYWIEERESIRLKKESGLPKPWTDDEILQRYRFCNVRRMDDKVSQWLFENWYELNFNHPNMLLAVALARFINLPGPLEFIGFPLEWNPGRIIKKLRQYKEENGKAFNGAYMVRGNDGIDKIECVVKYYVNPLGKVKLNTDSCEESWGAIKSSYGFGSFMAGQVVADLRWAVKGKWDDKFDWAAAGPGSQRGLNRFLDLHVKIQMGQENFLEELLDIINYCGDNLPASIVNRLEAIDYQNCLCEYDKYSRVLLGEGKPKQLYRGLI